MRQGRGSRTAWGAILGGVLAVASASAWWWVAGAPDRVGFTRTSCAGQAATSAGSTGSRSGLDRTVVPVGPLPVAPLRSTVCRYAADGVAVAGWSLDPARTASLAADVAAPMAGYPADALAAKRIPPLTDAELAANAPPPCPGQAPTDVITFGYMSGPAVVVRVRSGPCDDLTNGTLTIRTPPRVTAALAALPAL